jgi:hypothetical protein
MREVALEDYRKPFPLVSCSRRFSRNRIYLGQCWERLGVLMEESIAAAIQRSRPHMGNEKQFHYSMQKLHTLRRIIVEFNKWASNVKI